MVIFKFFMIFGQLLHRPHFPINGQESEEKGRKTARLSGISLQMGESGDDFCLIRKKLGKREK